MKETRITMPELAMLAGTRAMMGAGIAFLLAKKISQERRRRVGWALFLVGAVSTLPLAMLVLGKKENVRQQE